MDATSPDLTAPAQDAAPAAPAEPPAPEAPTPAQEPAQPPAATAEEAQQAGPGASDWAAYHRRVKDLSRRERALKEQEAELRAIRDLRQRAQQDPWSVASELFGQDWYERATMHFASQAPGGHEQPLDPRVEALREEVRALKAERQAEAERARQAEHERTWSAALDASLALARRESARYPRIARLGDQVRGLIRQTAEELARDEDGRVRHDLRDDEVLDAVEHRLAEAARMLAIGDHGSTQATESNGARATSSKTLTNRTASGSATTSTDDALPIDPDARDREILRRIRLFQPSA